MGHRARENTGRSYSLLLAQDCDHCGWHNETVFVRDSVFQAENRSGNRYQSWRLGEVELSKLGALGNALDRLGIKKKGLGS
jgi:hypothetical protein